MSSIRKWANAIEEALWKMDQLSGLFSHRGLIGANRKSPLIGILREFLPNNITVSRGQLLDMNGETSSQLDIIIPRTPHI